MENNSNSRHVKQGKSKDNFPLTIFFFLDTIKYRKSRKLYSLLVHLDSRICACGFEFKLLKSKYHVWIVLKYQEFD